MQDIAEPPESNAPANAGVGAPLVWHPWIRGLAWIAGWYVISLSAATIWEFADTGTLREGSTLARGVLILLAITLLTGVVFLLEIWGSLWMHAFRSYDSRFAPKIIAAESLVVIALLAPYLWFVMWALKHSWPYLHGLGASFAAQKAGGDGLSFLPAWSVWGVLLPACVLIARWAASSWREAWLKFRYAIQLLGFRRTVHGVLLMNFLRLRLPRKDFFQQSPVFSWLLPLALCVLLHVVIEQPVLKWMIPAVLVGFLLPYWSDMMVPPTWLFLGKSDFDSFAAFESMRRTWRQHGLTLLDRVGQGGTEFYVAWRKARRASGLFFDPSAPRIWSLRTRPQLWEQTVRLLMDFVPVVVVDVRGDSDIVCDELAWLAKPRRVEKAWYLVAQDEQGAPLDPDHVSVPTRSRMVTERMLLTAEWSRAGLRIGQTAAPSRTEA